MSGGSKNEFEVSTRVNADPKRIVIRFRDDDDDSCVIRIPEGNIDDVVDAIVKVRNALASARQATLSVKWD